MDKFNIFTDKAKSLGNKVLDNIQDAFKTDDPPKTS